TGFLSFVRPQDGDADGWSPMNNGWLLRDGIFSNVDKTKSRMKNFRDPMTGWSQHMQVEVTDVLGRTMAAEGFCVSHICEHGDGSNALMRWEIDGKIGWGEDQDSWQPEHFRRMLDALRSTRRVSPEIKNCAVAPSFMELHALKQHAATNRAFNLQMFFQRHFAVLLIDIDDDIADAFDGLQVLAADIDVVVGKHFVDRHHHARHVAMHVQQAVFARV